MKSIVFTVFFTCFLLFFISNVFAEYSIGIQPSIIQLSISPNYDQMIVPYRLWNQGSDPINISIVPENISDFTNFTALNLTLKAHTNRTDGYITIPIVFKRTTGNISTEGGLKIKPILPSNGTISLIPEIFARVLINQTDKNTNNTPYYFPVNTSSSGASGSISETTQNFFIQNKKTIGIIVIGILVVIAMLAIYKFFFQTM